MFPGAGSDNSQLCLGQDCITALVSHFRSLLAEFQGIDPIGDPLTLLWASLRGRAGGQPPLFARNHCHCSEQQLERLC